MTILDHTSVGVQGLRPVNYIMANQTDLVSLDYEEDEETQIDLDMIDNVLQVSLMSEVFFHFIEPYYDEDETDTLRQILLLAQMAWNTSLLPKKEQIKSLNSLFSTFPGDPKSHGTIRSMIQSMIARRKRYFAQFKRRILEFQLEETDDKIRLTVFSEPI